MTHRSPLVTLLGLVVAFAIMFGVNLASSEPRDSYTAGPSPSATGHGGNQPRQPDLRRTLQRAAEPDPPARHLRRVRRRIEKFPNKVVYAGRTDDDSAAIAVAILGDKAAAYLCDGQ